MLLHCCRCCHWCRQRALTIESKSLGGIMLLVIVVAVAVLYPWLVHTRCVLLWQHSLTLFPLLPIAIISCRLSRGVLFSISRRSRRMNGMAVSSPQPQLSSPHLSTLHRDFLSPLYESVIFLLGRWHGGCCGRFTCAGQPMIWSFCGKWAVLFEKWFGWGLF